MKFLYKNRTTLTWLTLLILTNLLTIYLLINGFLQFPNTVILQNDSKEFLYELTKLNDLNNTINRNYINEIDNKDLGEKLVDSMFNNIGDRYSDYYTEDEYKELMNSFNDSFGGIGVSIDSSNPNEFLIINAIKDSPADEAGIKEGDILIKVNNEDIRGQDIDLVISKTRGEIGTNVNVTVLRNNHEITFNLKRDKIVDPSVESENIDGIGYIYIDSFGFETPQQFEEALNSLINEDVTGVIIDLRYNGGGIVQSAIQVADLLLDEDQVGYAIDNKNNRSYFVTKKGKIDIPFVVLVNEYTASASELLSGSLQKSGHIIIGQKTFGKGVIQQMAHLQDGTGYKLTFQEYYLKDDSKVNNEGITPNIIVDNEFNADQSVKIDHQLNTALEYLRNH